MNPQQNQEYAIDLLNLGEMGALALHVMAMLAKSGERMSAELLAQDLSASKHTLHKVAGRLVRAGLLESTRGKTGGLAMTLDPTKVTLMQVLEAAETGATGKGGCLFSKRVCAPDAKCFFSELTGNLSRQIREYFSGTTVSDIANAMDSRQMPHRQKKE